MRVRDCLHELVPAIVLANELVFAGWGEAVILGAAVGLGRLPLSGERAFGFEQVERGAHGTVLADVLPKERKPRFGARGMPAGCRHGELKARSTSGVK